jgi:uncharacterized protein
MQGTMNILAVSDVELNIIYSPSITTASDIDLMIGCGDLPYYYMEYMISTLDRTLYYVRGNHAPKPFEEGDWRAAHQPVGRHRPAPAVKRDPSGLLLAGIEGSLQYNKGKHQYTQTEMWLFCCAMVPTAAAQPPAVWPPWIYWSPTPRPGKSTTRMTFPTRALMLFAG